MNARFQFGGSPNDRRFDYVLVGGGLQGGLLLLAILQQNPRARIAVVEPGDRFGGNHTWSLHDRDVPDSARSWFEELVVARHPHYDVAFPRLHRRVSEPYSAVTSQRLAEVVLRAAKRAPEVTMLRARARELTRATVTLEDGQTIAAQLVVDARGPERVLGNARHFQKFVGLELVVEPRSAPSTPTLMDATVAQRDGFRFLYVLPLAPDRVLVEDTYYSDSAELDDAKIETGILSHADALGMVVTEVARKERGILPLPLRPPTLRSGGGPLVAGYAGGYFHPTTGYSFPFALRLALLVAERSPEPFDDGSLALLQRTLQRQQRFACWLTRLLFSGFPPERRCGVLERFYRLPEDTIRRFYSLETTPLDRARIVCGRPPSGFSLRSFAASSFPTPGHAP